ncbi:50S ribosomal protein L6 [Candidatus Fermentibacterales bacterium]|nr:50S ribosomal protein L6 [Candidatus Fermentibacterales bacterium]
MSRVGKLPIRLPEGVTAAVKKKRGGPHVVTITGPRGEMLHELPEGISVSEQDGRMVVERSDDSADQRRLHGVTRAHLANKVKGVSVGHEIVMIVQGKGYQAEVAGKVIDMQIGFSHRVVVELPRGVTAEVRPGQNQFTLVLGSNDRHLLGHLASTIYRMRPAEPYNLTGIRYEGRPIRRKTAKTAAAGA